MIDEETIEEMTETVKKDTVMDVTEMTGNVPIVLRLQAYYHILT